MKLSHLFLALTLSACALTAQAQTDNVRRHKTTTSAAKPAAKPATKPAAKPAEKPTTKPAAKPAVKPAAQPVQEPEATPKQETEASSAVVEENKVYDVVEQPPTFPGGMSALMQHLATHVKYPKAAQEQKIQGTVILKFVVLEDGSVSDVEVSKSLDPHCDEEAVRVVKELPRFTPGKQQGKPVRVWLTLPIRFRL